MFDKFFSKFKKKKYKETETEAKEKLAVNRTFSVDQDLDSVQREELETIQAEEKYTKGRLGDKYISTRKATRYALTFIASVVTIFLSVVFLIRGEVNKHNYIVNNTTPIGTELTFPVSQQQVTLAGVWTNKDKNVLVARIHYPDQAKQNLSFKGKNYHIFVGTTRGHKINDLYGQYSLLGKDGDGYLILTGAFEHRAYQIFIVNELKDTSLVASNGNVNTTNAQNSDTNTIANLSNYSYNDVNNKGFTSYFHKKSNNKNTPDTIQFRLNAYSKNTTISSLPFTTKGDNINYHNILEETTVRKATKQIKSNIASEKSSLKQLNVQRNEYISRLPKKYQSLFSDNVNKDMNTLSTIQNDIQNKIASTTSSDDVADTNATTDSDSETVQNIDKVDSQIKSVKSSLQNNKKALHKFEDVHLVNALNQYANDNVKQIIMK